MLWNCVYGRVTELSEWLLFLNYYSAIWQLEQIVFQRDDDDDDDDEVDFDFDFWCFNATFSNISAISWRPVLVVEEAGVPGENNDMIIW